MEAEVEMNEGVPPTAPAAPILAARVGLLFFSPGEAIAAFLPGVGGA